MFGEEYDDLGTAMKPCSEYDSLDWIISFIWPFLFIGWYAVSDTYLLHWFVIPVYLCGVFISIDAVHWCRGKMDTFDPKGLVGLFGCNFFVLSPILAVYYKVERVGVMYLGDFRPWMGGMALLNLFGIILYRYFEKKVSQKPMAVRKYWFENPGRSSSFLLFSMVIIAFCHGYFTITSGGAAAYIARRTTGDIGALAGTVGLGPINIIGRALPIMLLITITVWFRKSGRQVSFVSMAVILFVFLIGQFLVTGFTGSRASVLWALFWAAGIVHFFWRPISVKLVLISIVPLMVFLYLYGFYKEMGAQALDVFRGRVSMESLEYESNRTFARVLVGDMGRSDVQAVILSVALDPDRDYDFRYGKTYLTSCISMIPRKIWPSKPDDNGKVVAGTDMFYGKGTYGGKHVMSIGKRATQIYGLAGEAMLNFGIWGVLPAFAVWGCIVGWIRRRILNYSVGDMRLLTAPYWILISFFLLIQDLDNFVGVSVYNWLVPAVIIWMIAYKIECQGNNTLSEPY